MITRGGDQINFGIYREAQKPRLNLINAGVDIWIYILFIYIKIIYIYIYLDFGRVGRLFGASSNLELGALDDVEVELQMHFGPELRGIENRENRR